MPKSDEKEGKGPGSVVLPKVRVWVMPADEKIRISVGGSIIGTVDPKPSAARQAHLYRKLKGLLAAEGKWLPTAGKSPGRDERA